MVNNSDFNLLEREILICETRIKMLLFKLQEGKGKRAEPAFLSLLSEAS